MEKSLKTLRLLMVALVCAALPVNLQAGSHDDAAYRPENIAEISILPGWRQANGSHVAALRVTLAEGWKTYWRAPGESGIPPSFTWEGSQNLQGVAFHWPVPQVFNTSGLQTIGYHDELILPIEFFPEQSGGDITLSGRVSLGVCRDICMPMEAQFTAVLPGNAGRGDGSNLIRRAIKQSPETAAEAGLGAISCDVVPISDGMRVTATLDMPRLARGEVVVFETANQDVWIGTSDVERHGRTLIASADFVPPASAPFMLSRSDIRITVLAGGKGVDIANCVNGS